MKIKDNYRMGDYNVLDDRSGQKKKRSECLKEWTGMLVARSHWEPRHPQDFVKGIRDEQRVEDARPYTGGTATQTETTLDAAELPGQTVLSVTSTVGMTVGDGIYIHLDNDETHFSTISSFSEGDTVTIASAIPYTAASGNKVVIMSNLTSANDL